jgi:TonB-linked SusC/RagA family outer membrane protein
MKKILLLALFLLSAFLPDALAQNRTITGKVTDASNGDALPGVTVLVKETQIGTTTNANGEYAINVPPASNTLTFSFVGYLTTERTIGNATTLNVALPVDAKQLSEVLVTTYGGIQREQKSLGYSAQVITNESLTQGRDRSVLNSLQGKVAGVQISNASGGVGSSTRVVIRGNKSFTGSNQPLYVIDGIPIDNSSFGTGDNLNNGVDSGNRANDINPEDVESVNILKGPAATALYGSRAANGAIVITTKSGSAAADRGRKAEITYTSSYVLEDILRLPKFQNRYGQGGDPDPAIGIDLRENFSWGPKFDGVVRPWGQVIDGQQRIKPYVGLPDNVKEFFDLGSVFTNSLALAGGDADTHYRVSISHLNQEGIVPTTAYSRSTAQFSGGTKLSNKFSSSASFTYTKSGGDLAVTGQGPSVYDQIIQTPRDISLLEQKDLNNKFNTINGYYGAYTSNPYQILQDNSYQSNVDRLLGNIQIGFAPTDKLNFTYRVGTDVYSDRRKQFTAPRRAVGQNDGAQNNDGEINDEQYFVREFTSDIMGTFKTDISPDLNVAVLVGHNIFQRNLNHTGINAAALVSRGFQGLNNVKGNFQNIGAGTVLRRLHGLYSTLDFGFRDYLFLGVTARNDWSSTLPIKNNSFFYPSVNTSFVFTEALDMSSNVLSYGKLRASYAEVGLDASPYLVGGVFPQASAEDGFDGTNLVFPFNGVPGYEVGDRIPNPDLKPELTKSWEFGGEVRFLNNRLAIDATYFDAQSTNQIFNVPVSTSSGFRTKTLNAGIISNKGIELLVSGTPVKVGDFNWDASVNFTRIKNEVVELFEGVDEILIGTSVSIAALVAHVGEPYGSFRATGYRYDPEGHVVVGATGLPLLATETALFGNIQPDYTAGLTNTFRYKGLSMNVVFDMKEGGKLYSRTKSVQKFVGSSPETLFNDRQPFIVPNSVQQQADGTYVENTTPVTDVPGYWGGLPDATDIIDASYIKLREVSLSYSVPTSLIRRSPFGNLQIGLSGRNLLLWTPGENTFVDPEINTFGNGNTQGFDYTGSPSLRSFGANIRVTF